MMYLLRAGSMPRWMAGTDRGESLLFSSCFSRVCHTLHPQTRNRSTFGATPLSASEGEISCGSTVLGSTLCKLTAC